MLKKITEQQFANHRTLATQVETLYIEINKLATKSLPID